MQKRQNSFRNTLTEIFSGQCLLGWPSNLIDTSPYWHLHRVAIGINNYVSHIFPPFPWITMFTVFLHRYLHFFDFIDRAILITLFFSHSWRWWIHLLCLLLSSPFHFWLQLVPGTHWPLAHTQHNPGNLGSRPLTCEPITLTTGPPTLASLLSLKINKNVKLQDFYQLHLNLQFSAF